jgi:hypothetical protein
MAADSYVRAAREHARATDDVLRCAAAVLAAQDGLARPQAQIFANGAGSERLLCRPWKLNFS